MRKLEGYVLSEDEYLLLKSCCELLTQYNNNRMYIQKQLLKEMKRGKNKLFSDQTISQNSQDQQDSIEQTVDEHQE